MHHGNFGLFLYDSVAVLRFIWYKKIIYLYQVAASLSYQNIPKVLRRTWILVLVRILQTSKCKIQLFGSTIQWFNWYRRKKDSVFLSFFFLLKVWNLGRGEGKWTSNALKNRAMRLVASRCRRAEGGLWRAGRASDLPSEWMGTMRNARAAWLLC